jgi:hypothetical protein
MTLPGLHLVRCVSLQAQINELRTPEYRECPDAFPHVQDQIDLRLDELSRLRKANA